MFVGQKITNKKSRAISILTHSLGKNLVSVRLKQAYHTVKSRLLNLHLEVDNDQKFKKFIVEMAPFVKLMGIRSL